MVRKEAMAEKKAARKELKQKTEEVERAYYFASKLLPSALALDIIWGGDKPPTIYVDRDYRPPNRFAWEKAVGKGSVFSSCNRTAFRVTAPEVIAEKDLWGSPTRFGQSLACLSYDKCFGKGDNALRKPCIEAIEAGEPFDGGK